MPSLLITYDNYGKPICEICAKSFDRLMTHVRQSHGMDSAQYRQKFGYCKSTTFSSKDSSALSRQRVLENRKLCIEGNLIHGGMKTRARKNHRQFKHVVTLERRLILEQARAKQDLTKPRAKCQACHKFLSNRKGKLCLKHYREAMSIRNKKAV